MLLFLPVRREDRERCESAGAVIQSDSVEKIVKASRSSFRGVRFVVEGEHECLGNESLYHNSSSSPVPQSAPPVAKSGTIGIDRRTIKFVGSPPTPSFITVVGSSIPQPPATILTLLGLVRIPARV